MEILVDTHVLLWSAVNDRRLSRKAVEMLADKKNWIYVSSAVIWEISIKASLKKLSFPGSSFSTFVEELEQNDYQMLSITPGHAKGVYSLPFHHQDPFDRILISQCLQEKLPIISSDDKFDKYGVKRIW